MLSHPGSSQGTGYIDVNCTVKLIIVWFSLLKNSFGRLHHVLSFSAWNTCATSRYHFPRQVELHRWWIQMYKHYAQAHYHLMSNSLWMSSSVNSGSLESPLFSLSNKKCTGHWKHIFTLIVKKKNRNKINYPIANTWHIFDEICHWHRYNWPFLYSCVLLVLCTVSTGC